MTVGELICKLQELDHNMDVVIIDEYSGVIPPKIVIADDTQEYEYLGNVVILMDE
jgi:hypothetical protein